MRILFGGEVKGNSGPSNVNRSIRANFTESFTGIDSRNKYRKTLEGLGKCLRCDVVVLSGVTRFGCILLGIAKIFRKKTVFIMHGCGEYEVELNHIQGMEKGLRQEQFLLQNADLLLPVSRKFMIWFQERYPQYADKTKYLFNGIDTELLQSLTVGQKKAGTAAAAGGSQILKNNQIVAQAVEELGGSVRLNIYGPWQTAAPAFQHSCSRGHIPHGDFIAQLKETELFILNSLFETFSIAVIEALLCGCSVLVSEVAGVTDLLALEENDMIHDPMDVEEIKRKILYLQENPNNERILSQLDLNEWSYRKSVQRLEQLCAELVKTA